MITFTDALIFVANAHKGQTDIQGQEYIHHPVRIAYRLREKGYDINYQILALFHDILEDTPTTTSDLIAMGVPIDVIDALKLLTHKKNRPVIRHVSDFFGSYSGIHKSSMANAAEYIYRYIAPIAESKNIMAITVKLEDLADNKDPNRMDEHAKDVKYHNRMAKYELATKILTDALNSLTDTIAR